MGRGIMKAYLHRAPAPAFMSALKVTECAFPYQIVRARHGWFVAGREDTYVGRSLLTDGEYAEGEWELIAQLLARKRDAVEVGANIGAH